METIPSSFTDKTSIRPPAELIDFGYVTIGQTRQQIAREIFNLRAIDIAFEHDSVDSFVSSLEFKELEIDTVIMAGQEYFHELLVAFITKNVKIFKTKY